MRLNYSLLVVALVMCHTARADDYVVLYQEDFEDGAAERWNLEPGWQLLQDEGGWVLYGEDHYWAMLDQVHTTDFHLHFSLEVLRGSVHLVFRLNDEGRYFISFSDEGSELHKHYWPDDIRDSLAIGPSRFDESRWYEIELRLEGRIIELIVDGELQWLHDDSEPLAWGGFAFETLEDSAVLIDNIVILEPATDDDPHLIWSSTGGPLGGLGYDIRFRPGNTDVMYVTDSFAGAFKSSNGGRNWYESNQGIRAHPLTGVTPVFSLTIDPHDPDIIWIGLQDLLGIYKSSDAGHSWVRMDNGVDEPDGLISFRGFTVDPRSSDIVYAAGELYAVNENGEALSGREFDITEGVVYKTTDGGANWRKIWHGENLARYIWIDPRDPEVLYVSTGIFDREAANSVPDEHVAGGVGILKSTDGGQTWQQKNDGLGNLYVGSLFMHPDDPDILLAGTGNNVYLEGRGVYITTNGAESWQQVVSDEVITSVELAESNPQVAYAGSSESVFRSDDGGFTWDRVSHDWGPPGIRAGFPIDFQVDPADVNRLFANNYLGGNFESPDGGRSWIVASKGYTGAHVRGIATDPSDPARVYAAARSGVFSSVNRGEDWVGLNNSPIDMLEWTAVAIDPADPTHLLVSSNWARAIYQSHNRGQSWTQVYSGGAQIGFPAIVFAASSPETVYAATAAFDTASVFNHSLPAEGILVSHDGGDTWQAANDTRSDHVSVVGLAVDPRDARVVLAATFQEGVLKTVDGGQSWAPVNQGLPGQPLAMSVAFHPHDSETIYVGLESAGLYTSENAGAVWRPLSVGLNPNATISDLVFDPNDDGILYIADRVGGGVYRSANDGQEWEAINTNLRIHAINRLAFTADGDHLYAASEGGGVYRLDFATSAPPTSDEDEEVGPDGVGEEPESGADDPADGSNIDVPQDTTPSGDEEGDSSCGCRSSHTEPANHPIWLLIFVVILFGVARHARSMPKTKEGLSHWRQTCAEYAPRPNRRRPSRYYNRGDCHENVRGPFISGCECSGSGVRRRQ